VTAVPDPAAVAVAVVGLGRMGGPMADHLVAAGHRVAVHDLDPAAVAARVEQGATGAATPAAAGQGADVVSIVVFDGAQARAVLDGPDGLLTTLEPTAVVGVHTTVSIDTMKDLAALGAEHGVTVVDAGISGGESGAAAGTLVTMVGGPPAAFATARPVFEAFSKEVVHAGPLGAGMALKLARNTTGYVMMAAVHEAMELASAAGVDQRLLHHVITETGVLDQALSPFALGGPAPLAADDPEELRQVLEHLDRLGTKDLAEALALADRLGADLTVTTATAAAFSRVTRLAPPS
jgi:3-hydroxyisobutyrate dehydrogenase